MNEIQFKQVEDPKDQALDTVALLFEEMYEYMLENGLMMPLAEDGVAKWMLTLKRTLKRFSTVELAVHGSDIVAFGHGALSMTPDYLGNKKVGVVTHIYVRPDYRKQKIAEKILERLEQWFVEQQCHSVELQVLPSNNAAIAFWKKNGFENELLQYRKMI